LASIAAVWAGSLTSTWIAVALRPSLRTAAAVSSAAARLRSATATLAPSSAKRMADARPMPLAALIDQLTKSPATAAG